MGSVGNQNPWAPYETYRDCSQGICSKYCPQWCYVFFPPPPTLELTDDDDSDTTFSPLIIAIIAILASGFLLVSYYIIITRVCRRGRHRRSVSADQLEASRDEISRDQWQVASTGLDEMLIKSITVCKYKKGDGLIEGTECAVCLNEFQENENLRLLPKCTHAFHLPCIDTWLKTHSNCPLCRSAAAPTSPSSPPPGQNSPSSLSLDVSALEIQRQNDLVLVVEDRERSSHRDEVVVSLVSDGFAKDHIEANGGGVENPEVRYSVAEIDEEGVKHFRRSISLGTFSCQRNLLIADILKIDEDDDIHGEISESQMGTASSKGPLEEQSKAKCNSRELESTTGSVVMKRSTSNGRFDVIHDKGKNSIIPN